MPDINNSLATQIQAPQIDIGGTLAKAVAIQRQQQDFEHKQFLYQQGGGYDPSELQTLATTKNTQAETYGRIGNILSGYRGPADLDSALTIAKQAGIPGADLYHAQLSKMPPDQIRNIGRQFQQYGQSSTESIGQNPQAIQKRAAGQTRGGIEGETTFDTDNNPPAPPAPKATTPKITQEQQDANIKNRVNNDGSTRVFSSENVVGPVPGASPLQRKQFQEADVANSVRQMTEFRERSQGSPGTKATIKSLLDDFDRVYTGKGAEQKQAFQKWIQGAQSLPGIGPVIKSLVPDTRDPVAAMENIDKNAGLISRSITQSLGTKAASALEQVSSTIVGGGTSNQGAKTALRQLMAMEDYAQATTKAANIYRREPGRMGSLDGFQEQWQEHMSPAAFMVARMASADRKALYERLSKSEDGPDTIKYINQQLKWGHEHGFDKVMVE
jgi:hypothetical protein